MAADDIPAVAVPLPVSKKELLSHIIALLGTSHVIPPQCRVTTVPSPRVVRLGGTGGPGRYLELLVGSQGKNKAIADSVGIEIKFHSEGSTLLTLFHHEVAGGGRSLRGFIEKYGWPDDENRRAYRHTVSATSYLRVVRARGRITVRPAEGGGPEVYWDEEELSRAVMKINHVVLVHGRVSTVNGQRIVQYDSAEQYIDLRCRDFLSSFGNRFILIDFDVREKCPGSSALRNHGTKFRMNVKDMPELWVRRLKWNGTMWVPVCPLDNPTSFC